MTRAVPLIFTPENVRAIVAGRKTQTRRVCRYQLDDGYDVWIEGGWLYGYNDAGVEVRSRAPCDVGDTVWIRETWCRNYDGSYRYLADYRDDRSDRGDVDRILWRPSIFMPKEAARISLSVTAVRAELLHDITALDAAAEACETRDAYRRLWDSISGKRYPWKSNPLVWVITFKRTLQ